MGIIDELRRSYHAQVCAKVIYVRSGNSPNMADGSNKLSRNISVQLLRNLGHPVGKTDISGQTAGSRLEQLTKNFLEDAFAYLQHVRPGKWVFSVHNDIASYDQYRHLHELSSIVKENKTLQTVLGDYLVAPDITIARQPLSDSEINRNAVVVGDTNLPTHTPLRENNSSSLILHASISCKWTIRSDRSQNARTEGLNLVRNRKGHTPHIAVVTGEPLPSRIASLAFGTGDIDCVYHFALHELKKAVEHTKDETALDMLKMMIDGRRLRDISDLPFDISV